ncbi:MAG: 16S rRNA (cytosine(967)-C(5))-methyltransferase RsmB [Gammaproteobacteria bacterium]|nr:16S rRNA (cytosine(967)-C(5))-methyltransferase RsmB [Gammaproteobacteria bacterium]
MQARAAAARALARLLREGASLDAVLPEALAGVDPGDRALVGELCYGTLRWHPRLAALAARLLHRPPRARDLDVLALVLVGLHQLRAMRVPSHAAVAETVAGARALGKPWAGRLVNAALRRYLREREALEREVDAEPHARLAHPRWLFEVLQEAWPGDWEAIAEANNARAPMTLRVNLAHGSRADYVTRLESAGLPAAPAPHVATGLVLERACDVHDLPGFDDGDVSVQDAAAQLAAPLLDAPEGARVLDACAAPGGKTTHLLERRPAPGRLLAVDRSEARLDLLRDNLARIGGRAEVRAADAGAPGEWWDGEAFDAVLLDAPCSGSGVIRRHPDIKLLRRADDLPRLAGEQARLLAALWPLVAPGGCLLYATCSVLPDENDKQISHFLANHTDAREDVIDAEWGHPCHHGRQILPGEDGMDGFYYARLIRTR